VSTVVGAGNRREPVARAPDFGVVAHAITSGSKARSSSAWSSSDDLQILERVDAHEHGATAERLGSPPDDLVELLHGGEPLIAAGGEVRVELARG
jgi:hypothetical protein